MESLIRMIEDMDFKSMVIRVADCNGNEFFEGTIPADQECIEMSDNNLVVVHLVWATFIFPIPTEMDVSDDGRAFGFTANGLNYLLVF